jgi:hypothetical protein
MSQINRRQFLAMLGVSTAASLVPLSFIIDKPDNTIKSPDVDPLAVTSESSITTSTYEGIMTDLEIAGRKTKMYGVAHWRPFVEHNFDTLDACIKDASVVIFEAPPDSNIIDNSHLAYCNTVFDLCKKYDKTIIDLDSRSSAAKNAEIVPVFAGTNAMMYGALRFNMMKFNEPIDKQDVLASLGNIVAGTGLTVASLLDESALKYDLRNSEDSMVRSPYLFNHTIDQRNVTLTNRLRQMNDYLTEEDFSKGDHVFVNFGAAHTRGVNFYMQHPVFRAVKSAIYAATYDLFDSNEIARFDHDGTDWVKQTLVK